MHRFFVTPDQISPAHVVLKGDQARQIVRVLRLGEGQRLIVLDGRGTEYEVEIVHASADSIITNILSQQLAAGEPAVRLTLYQGLLKRDKFEWVLQKATEVGVVRIVPVVTRRSLVQDTRLKANKVERWEKILTEAAEQSRRGIVPELAEPLTWAQALADVASADLALLAWEEGGLSLREGVDLAELGRASAEMPQTAALFIGPEGGFTAEEVVQAEQAGVRTISLGPRILRTETAAVVASALLLHELEQA